MKKKDLLIICQYFYPDLVSTGRLPTELAEDLVLCGMEVDVICGYPSYIVFDDVHKTVSKKEVYKGIHIRRIKYPNFNKNKKIGRLLNYFSFSFSIFMNIFRFRHYHKVLLISNPPMLPYFGHISKSLFKNKFIYLIYDLYPDIALALGVVKESSLMVKVMTYINKKVFLSSDAVVVLGEDMRQYLAKSKHLCNSEKIHVIPNWVDGNKVFIKEKINSFSVKEGIADKFIILYSGNIGLFQSLEMIIECAKDLQKYENIQFIFVGNGGKRNKLINMVSEYGLNNVKFYDFQPDEVYNDVLASADCFIVTLEKAAEGLGVPSKTYTYLAAGRPLIGILSEQTDIGTMIHEQEIGYRVSHGEVEELSGRILTLYENQEIKIEMGRRARCLFEKEYERKIITDRYFNMISDL